MTFLDVLLHHRVIFALLSIAIGSLVVELCGEKLLNAVADVPVTEWLFEHALIPVGRAVVLLLFIIVAYPILFGVESTVALSALFSAGRSRFSTLINLVFLSVLVLN